MKSDQRASDPGIRIVWWNTGLSPTRIKAPPDDDDIEAAARVLHHLIVDTGADIIVLGEMAEDSTNRLRQACEAAHREFSWLKAFHRAGRSRFSICVLSRTQRVEVHFVRPITKRESTSVIKVGLQFGAAPRDGAPFTLIASHWPSRLHMDRHDSERTHIAAFLRHWMEEHLRTIDMVNIVLIGDFNDEPFDEGLERYLCASRDRDKVHRNPTLLYNPFWRHLSSFEPAVPEYRVSDRGTYWHGNGKFSGWRTFDQLMVSSALLFGRYGWRLDEERTRVLPIPGLRLDAGNKAGRRAFDHLPNVGLFERLPL